MRDEFRRLKRWVEECPIEAAMRIEELEIKKQSLQKQLDAKLVFINNGWEEERYALQEDIIRLERDNKALKNLISADVKHQKRRKERS